MTLALEMFPPTGNRPNTAWLRTVIKFYFFFCVCESARMLHWGMSTMPSFSSQCPPWIPAAAIGRCHALDAVAGVGHAQGVIIPAVQAVSGLAASTLQNYVTACRQALDIVAKALGLLGDTEEQEEARRTLSGEQED